MENRQESSALSDFETERRIRYFRQNQERYDLLSNSDFIGKVFADTRMDTLTRMESNAQVFTAFADYEKNLEANIADGRSIGLIGSTGTGKTAFLVAFHRVLLNHQFNSLIVPMIEFFERLKNSFGSDEGKAIMATCKGVSALILDDLGRGMINPWRNERIIEILDHRWRHSKPTFFSSNLKSVDEFTAWLGDAAITDRLLMPDGNGAAKVKVFLMTGKSWR
jgi:DNA replication protein DnaC